MQTYEWLLVVHGMIISFDDLSISVVRKQD